MHQNGMYNINDNFTELFVLCHLMYAYCCPFFGRNYLNRPMKCVKALLLQTWEVTYFLAFVVCHFKRLYPYKICVMWQACPTICYCPAKTASCFIWVRFDACIHISAHAPFSPIQIAIFCHWMLWSKNKTWWSNYC